MSDRLKRLVLMSSKGNFLGVFHPMTENVARKAKDVKPFVVDETNLQTHEKHVDFDGAYTPLLDDNTEEGLHSDIDLLHWKALFKK